MVRFLLIVAMTCAVGAAGLGFFTRERLTRFTADAGAEKERSNKLQALSDDFQQKLLQAEEKIADQERVAQQEHDNWNSEVSAAKAKVDQLTEQLNQRENEIKGLTTAIADANRNLDQKKRAEDDRQLLANRLINVETELNQLRVIAAEKDKDGTVQHRRGLFFFLFGRRAPHTVQFSFFFYINVVNDLRCLFV